MNKKNKRFIFTTILLSLIIGLCIFNSSAVDVNDPMYWYDLSSSSTEKGILVIIGDKFTYQWSGSGGMEDYSLDEEGHIEGGSQCYKYKESTKLILGDYLTRIGAYAFYEFYNLETMYIPEEITEIHEKAFYKANVPEKIYFGGTQQAWEEMTKDLEGFENCTVYYNVEPCTEHEFTNYVSNNDATYTSDGTKTAICSKKEFCGEMSTVTDEGSRLPLGNVTNLTSTPLKRGAEIKWDAVEHATGYAVFKKHYVKYDHSTNKPIYEWVLVEYTTNLNCSLKYEPGDTKDIAVRAFMIFGDRVLWAPKYETLTTDTLIFSPEIFKAEKITGTSIKLKWNYLDGTGVRIFMYTGKGWKAIKTVALDYSYTVYDLEPNTKYTFAVRSYRKENGKVVWADEYTKLTVKTGFDSTWFNYTDNKNELTWHDVKGETGYQVWYFAKGDTKYTKLGNFAADTTSVKLNLEKGTTYTFRVRAYAKVGNSYVYSAFSDAKVVKIK